jgi:proline racemase
MATQSVLQFDQWRPPPGWSKISTIDMHTGGEPLRIITAGLPPLEGRTVLEKRRYFRERHDHLRTALMWEPRGHADMYGAVVTPSVDADLDVFFLHNEGYSTMCGHAVIALATLAAEAGITGVQRPELVINVPAGRIHARATMEAGKVTEAVFRNVPSFAYLRNQRLEIPGLGPVSLDVAYGGAYYAVVEAAPLGLELTARNCERLIDAGRRIKQTAASALQISHPFEDDLGFLYGTILTGPAQQPGHHSRNVCIFAEGEVDRSATGSGVSARAALHHARGELALNERIVIESIIGTTMAVEVVETASFGPHAAVIPEVRGTASVTGRNEFWLDPRDALRHGFLVR